MPDAYALYSMRLCCCVLPAVLHVTVAVKLAMTLWADAIGMLGMYPSDNSAESGRGCVAMHD